ncbi:hypothetical protein AHAT_17180 [Agarivorans sp. Toyoura001]|uniref:hypothetical protein n=1 Tax=Agarivorans sp. Toyoura001 TaxID=2283141 RepID=UPI0010E2CFFF|nr:hypothetical protein [Agarivorans sp. Toyoura001]GDY25828.1 hypothetical protein AHAT_17180 [Agarivorans sp. Toyoura001]
MFNYIKNVIRRWQAPQNKPIRITTVIFLIIAAIGLYRGDLVCLRSGCYGPLTLTLVSEDGEPVEDALIIMNHITSGWLHGNDFTYYHKHLMNTGEPTVFPRGFFYSPERPSGKNHEQIGIQLNIRHFDYAFKKKKYTDSSFYVSVPADAEGPVDLGDVVIAPIKYRMEGCMPQRTIEHYKNTGWSEAKLQREKVQRCSLSYVRTSTFISYILDIPETERERLINKHLPRLAADFLTETALDDVTQQQVEERVNRAITNGHRGWNTFK